MLKGKNMYDARVNREGLVQTKKQMDTFSSRGQTYHCYSTDYCFHRGTGALPN